MEQILGKITNVKFGKPGDYSFLFGLHLTFSLSDGGGICDGGQYCVNLSENCRWFEGEKQRAITKMIYKIHSILKDAKVNNISELIGKPVIVTIDDCGRFASFRILTEVM